MIVTVTRAWPVEGGTVRDKYECERASVGDKYLRMEMDNAFKGDVTIVPMGPNIYSVEMVHDD